MDVDYNVYAEGEALLGWLNCTVQVSSRDSFDSEEFLQSLAKELQKRLNSQAAEVAHLKMTLSPDGNVAGEIAAVNLVRNDYVPELSYRLETPVSTGQLIINLRAEAAPEQLGTIVRDALSVVERTFPGLTIALQHMEHFRPGKPTPTHRIERLAV